MLFSQTCEEFAVLLLYFLCTFELLLGMFLRYFVPQINRIFLLPVKQIRTVTESHCELMMYRVYRILEEVSHFIGVDFNHYRSQLSSKW